MKTQLENLEECRARLTVEFEQEVASKAYSTVIRQIAKEANIPGFPKGKIPNSIVEQKVSQQSIKQEAIGKLLEQHLDEIIKQENLQLLGAPQFESSNFNFDDLTVSLALELRPEVKLAQYKDYQLDVPVPPETSDQKISEHLEEIAWHAAQARDLSDDDEAQLKDLIEIDCMGKFTDATPIPDGELKNWTVELSDKQLMPGIVPQIVGMKIDEEREIQTTFPSDHQNKEFAGREAIYNVKLLSLKRKDPLPIDDELAQKNEHADLDSLKESIKKDFEQHRERIIKDRAKALILREIVDNAQVNIPSWLIERSAQAERPPQNDLTQNNEPSREELEQAESRLKTIFTLSQVAQDEGIQITQEEFNQAMTQFMQSATNINPHYKLDRRTLELMHDRLTFEKIAGWLHDHSQLKQIPEDPDKLKDLKSTAARFPDIPLMIEADTHHDHEH